MALLAAISIISGTVASSPALSPALDCALRLVAFEHGSARIRATDQLYDGLRLQECAGAPPRPAAAPAPPPTAPRTALTFYVSPIGRDNATGASPASAFASLLRARNAVRGAACRSSTPRCAALIRVGAGAYDLNATLELDDRDGDTTWLGDGARLGGAFRVRSDDRRLKWTHYKGAHGNLSGAWSADLSTVLPAEVRRVIALRHDRQNQGPLGSDSWDYGSPPPLINQLFVDDARQIRARWPNANPEDTSGLCFQNGNASLGEACAGWVAPDGGAKHKQPSGSPVAPAGGGWPCSTGGLHPAPSANCSKLSRSAPNRGLSPTFGCADCFRCGTFGPYWINDAPPDHPIYGTAPLVYGWTNASTLAMWSDIFSRPGGVVSYRATNRSGTQRWSSASIRSAVVHMFHGALWGWWAFNVASVSLDPVAPQIKFGYGGHQEARGWSVTPESHFFIENVLQELDDAAEWYFDDARFTLYIKPNTTAATAAMPKVLLSIPLLNQLISIRGRRTAGQAVANTPVENVRITGFVFSQTRSTFLSAPYEVPSAGDWSVFRGGALFIESARNVSVENCIFNQTGGNAIVLSGSVTDSSVSGSEFTRLGDSAIVLLGAAVIDDGTLPTYPNRNLIENNHVYDYGVYGKQVSAFFQALSANTTVRNNVFHGGPRAHVNLNDGFSGGNLIEGNLLFGAVRETADHGPVNTWNRMPYWTLNGVDDGFGSWTNITKPEPSASAIKDFDRIRRNLVFTDYGGSRALDHDDGSQFFIDSENVLIGSGVKNFLGSSKRFLNNLILGAGVRGISCYQSDSIGGNHVFANNTCQYSENSSTHGAPYKTLCSNATPGTAAFKQFMQEDSFAASGNKYNTMDGKFELVTKKPCPKGSTGAVPYLLSLAQTQADAGLEEGSSEAQLLGAAEAAAMARELLQM